MAEAITIACPECDKKITVPAAAVGKKIRCKGCDHVFVIEAPAENKAGARPAGKAAAAKAPAGKAAQAKKAPDAKAKPTKPKDDDDEDNNPYGVTSLDTSTRCPDCANEMESEDAVVCLHCGYNTRTREKARTRAVEDTTGGTWFWWLLPGILCALATLILFTFDIWYSFKIEQLIDDPDLWYAFITAAWFKIWIIWAPSIIIMVGTITFAVRRLILHPRPPEQEKKKKVK